MKSLSPFLSFVFWACVFALVYTQAPLYYSNQNQYFLHGLAEGGQGYLHEDWLANTKDPTPIFSKLIAWTYRFLDERCYYCYYTLIFGIYFHSLTGLSSLFRRSKETLLLRGWFLALFLLLHSAVLRYASGQLLRVDYPWYFQAGVAGQYILGPTFQPSVFGVLLLLAIYLFAVDRPWTAVLAACLGATVHTTYLLSAAILVLAFLYILFREGRRQEAVGLGSLALLLVAPIVGYNAVTFAPSSPEDFAAAQHILVHFRIPHHSVIADWLDEVAVAQILWVLAALFVVHQHRLFPVLLFPVLVGFCLTVLQLATGNDTLALLFPWRVSVFLMPLATTILLTRLLDLGSTRLPPLSEPSRRIAAGALVGLILLAVVGGCWISLAGLAYPTDADEVRLFQYVRDNRTAGQVFLLPLELPGPRLRRGAFMNDFVPPAVRKPGARLIPVHLQRFRLHTGTPIFVDFKAIPYQDSEVLEWYRRLREVQEVYRRLEANDYRTVRQLLARQNTTHMVLLKPVDIPCDLFEKLYEDERYVVCKIHRPAEE